MSQVDPSQLKNHLRILEVKIRLQRPLKLDQWSLILMDSIQPQVLSNRLL